jgi:hypothetical protein
MRVVRVAIDLLVVSRLREKLSARSENLTKSVQNSYKAGRHPGGEIIRLASLHYLTGKLCIAAPARAQRQAAPGAGA